MQGKVVIGAELTTKDFDREIADLENELETLIALYEEMAEAEPFEGQERELTKLSHSITSTKEKIARLTEEKDRFNKTDFSSVTKSLDNVGGSISKVIKKVSKWALAVFGIRSAYLFVRSAMSTLTEYDTQLKADIDYMKSALAFAIEPIVRGIVNLAKQLMQTIGWIVYKLTGKNIFENANKSLASANKQATKLSKTIAGFDEMNVLQDTSSSGSGGGASTPSFDLTIPTDNMSFFEKAIGKIKDKWKEMTEYLEKTDWQKVGSNFYQNIKKFFTSINWGEISDSIFEGLGAVFGAISGFIIGFLRDAWKDISKYFGEWIKKSEEMGGNVVDGILAGILNAIAQIGIWIYEHVFKPFIEGFKKAFEIKSPSKVMMKMGEYIIDGLKEGLVNIWNKVKGIFENLKNNIIKVFSIAWDGVKKVFSNVGSFFSGIVNKIYSYFKNIGTTSGSIIASSFKSVVNGVLRTIENILNSPIRAINSLIGIVNKISPIKISKLSAFSLPRLAQGGIVNNPGKGVLMGNYIAGERSSEAVLPLTEEVFDRLGLAIGKHTSINATIPVYAYNRQVAREIRRIEANQSFALNR